MIISLPLIFKTPVPRGNTDLSSEEYDKWLAENKRERELLERKHARRNALKKDLSGYYFNVDGPPIKVHDVNELRRELDKRGLAIYGEYTGKKDDKR